MFIYKAFASELGQLTNPQKHIYIKVDVEINMAKQHMYWSYEYNCNMGCEIHKDMAIHVATRPSHGRDLLKGAVISSSAVVMYTLQHYSAQTEHFYGI